MPECRRKEVNTHTQTNNNGSFFFSLPHRSAILHNLLDVASVVRTFAVLFRRGFLLVVQPVHCRPPHRILRVWRGWPTPPVFETGSTALFHTTIYHQHHIQHEQQNHLDDPPALALSTFNAYATLLGGGGEFASKKLSGRHTSIENAKKYNKELCMFQRDGRKLCIVCS